MKNPSRAANKRKLEGQAVSPGKQISEGEDAPATQVQMRPARRGIQSIETGFGILDVLCKAGTPIPLRSIAEQADLTVANTHYYLVSFQKVGVVLQDRDTGHYGLGSSALKLGMAALQQFDVYKVARPIMVDISIQTGHTVFLGVWGNKGPTIVYRVEGGKSPPLFELRVGSVLPLLSSALGRNFLAYLPRTVTEAMVEEELVLIDPHASMPYAADVPKSWDVITTMIASIREQGLSRCQDALLPHFTSLSAPIFDQTGAITAGITIMGPSHLLDPAAEMDVARLLRSHSLEISSAAGWYG